MMSLVSNIDDVAYYTALENDKIIDTAYEGSFSVGAGGGGGAGTGNIVTKTISHLHGENILPIMCFSNDDSTYYDAGSTIYTEGVTLDKAFTATVGTDSTGIYVIGQNFTGGSLTCYFKVAIIAEN